MNGGCSPKTHPDVLFLGETKMETIDRGVIRSFWGSRSQKSGSCHSIEAHVIHFV